MLRAVAEHIGHAMANGDLDAARVAHQAIGRLLGRPPLPEEADDFAPAVDLASGTRSAK
jgi:hypothetical protein